MGRKHKPYDDSWVQSLKPTLDKKTGVLKRHRHPDPLLLHHYVVVEPSLTRSSHVCPRDPYGKQTWKKIGTFDQRFTIERAREEAKSAIDRIKAGKTAFAPPPPTPQSFESVARQWIKLHVRKRNLLTGDAIAWRVEKYLIPAIGARNVLDLKRSEIIRLGDAIEAEASSSSESGERTAELALGLVNQILKWYEERSEDDSYIAPKVKTKRRAASDDDEHRDTDGSRTRTLSDDEIRQLWALYEQDPADTWASLCVFTSLTGQRLAKYLGMRRSDVSDDGVWTVSSRRRGKGTAERLLLPQLALTILQRRPHWATDDHLFPSERGGAMKLSPGHAMTKLRRRLPADMRDWSHHDVRRSWRTLAARAGVEDKIAELVHGHKQKGVQRIYNRFDYTPQKAVAVEKVSQLVSEIVHGPADKVVPMRPRAEGVMSAG